MAGVGQLNVCELIIEEKTTWRINEANSFSSGKCKGAVTCDQNLPPGRKRLSKPH